MVRGGEKIEQRKYAQFSIPTEMATAVNGFSGSLLFIYSIAYKKLPSSHPLAKGVVSCYLLAL